MNQKILFSSLWISAFVICSYTVISQGVKGVDTRRHSIQITKYGVHSKNKKGKNLRAGDQVLKSRGSDSSEYVILVGHEPLSSVDTEVVAAMDFVQGLNGYSVKYQTFNELKKNPKQLTEAAVVWFHRCDSSAFTPQEADKRIIHLLYEYLEEGGNLLLTMDAFQFINLLGIETVSPSVRLKPAVDEGYGRKLGFHAYRDHPLFSGLHGGSYIYKPVGDLTVRVNGFFGDTVPGRGRVVAIDWDYIFFRENSKVIVEYDVGKGKVIGVGAYMLFSAPNENRLQLDVFTRNTLDYMTGKMEGASRFYWDYSTPVIVACPEKVRNRDVLFEAVPEALIWDILPSPLAFPIHPATNDYCESAGERILIMSHENGGIEEIWTHPFMTLRDFSSGIRNQGSDSILWLSKRTPEIEIRPEGFIRHYTVEQGILDEIVIADPSLPCGVVHYEWHGNKAVELSIHFKTNLRLMWPYPAEAIGSICQGWDMDLNAFYFTDKSGDFAVMVGGNRSPTTHEAKQGDGFILNAGLTYSLEPGDALDVVFTSGTSGIEETTALFDQVIRDPYAIFANNEKHVDALFNKSLLITTPDKNFNSGYKWALIGTDRFFVSTPGMGSALVAGYGTTKRGWDGAQKVSGRPGYSWYFGRDGQWSGFALLDYGDFEKVRMNLAFFLKYQDLNGKIFHEATTSGVIHYDAADATPLFIVLAGSYLSHSGDTSFIRSNWKGIKKAIDFCYSTDTDQDYLIENTNVGHGWIEGGELFGSHSSFYLTGCWLAALKAAAEMAETIGDPDVLRYQHDMNRLQTMIDQKFWNPTEQFYAYGLNKDGSQRTEATILAAVPACFGITDKNKTRFLLDQYASNTFSTNWGTRIISEESPMFNPTGYHYGSVWPLFTGWTALAEYRYGNYTQGYSHILNNMNISRHWGLGYVEEVLNGAVYQPSGVCPHQCWSETMVLQPVIEGMLGIEVDAHRNTLNFSPRIPADWNSLTVKKVRLGNQVVNLSFQRDSSMMRWQCYKSGNLPVTVNMQMAIPPDTKIEKLLVNGKEYPFTTFTTSRNITLMMNFLVDSKINIEIGFIGGISVLPRTYTPGPGEKAEGMRIIDANLRGYHYTIDLEGVAESSDTLSVWSYHAIEEPVENATFVNRSGYITNFLVHFEAGGEKYVKKKVIISLNKPQ